jgi:hypothetical protein
MMGPSGIHCEDDLPHSNLPARQGTDGTWIFWPEGNYTPSKLLKSGTGLAQPINAPTNGITSISFPMEGRGSVTLRLSGQARSRSCAPLIRRSSDCERRSWDYVMR